MECEIRLLAVQTNRWECAEVDVFALLARQVTTSQCARLLLIQGVDETTSLPHPARAAALTLFTQSAAIEVIPLDLGCLGRSDGSRMAKLFALLRLTWQMPGLMARIRAWNPDLVYSAQQVWDIYLATVFAYILRRPRITHLHFTVGPWLGRGVIASLRSASLVVCVSDFIRRNAADHGIIQKQTQTIYNSLLPDYLPDPDIRDQARHRLRLSLGLGSETQIILMVAALNAQKDQSALIEAFSRIGADCPQAHLALAGEADTDAVDYADRLKRRVSELGLQGRVHFLGFRRDVPELLAACEVFAHPSHQDALPNAVQEASCAGLPIVAWDEGGVAEIVQQGVTGLLAETGDVSGLADCLRRLVQDPALAHEMGRNGQDRIRHVFNAELTSSQFCEALRSVTKAS